MREVERDVEVRQDAEAVRRKKDRTERSASGAEPFERSTRTHHSWSLPSSTASLKISIPSSLRSSPSSTQTVPITPLTNRPSVSSPSSSPWSPKSANSSSKSPTACSFSPWRYCARAVTARVSSVCGREERSSRAGSGVGGVRARWARAA